MNRALKWITALTLALILIICTVLTWALGSNSGTRWTIELVETLEPRLSIVMQGGSFWSGLRIDTLEWNQRELSLRLENFQSRWDFRCLRERKICIERLWAESIIVRPGESGEEADSAPTGPIKLPEIRLPVGIELDDLHIDLLRIEMAETANDIRAITLQAALSKDRLNIAGLGVRYDDYTAGLKGKIHLSGDYPLDIHATLTAEKRLEGQDQRLELGLSNTVSELHIDGQLSGAITAAFQGDVQSLQENLPYSARLNWQQIDWPPGAEELVVSSTDGQLDITGEMLRYELALRTDLTGPNIPANGVDLQAHGDARQLDIDRLAITLLDGDVSLTGQLHWSDQLAWDAIIQLAHLNPGVQWPDFPGQLDGGARVSGAIANGELLLTVQDLSIQGELRDHPLSLRGRFAKKSGDEVDIETFSLHSGANTITAKGVVGERWNLSGNIQLTEMHTLAPGLDGDLRGAFAISGALTSPDIHAELESDRLSYANKGVNGIHLLADIKELGLAPSSFELSARKLTAGGTTINSAQIDLEGTRTSHSLQLAVESPDYRAGLQLSGEMAPEMDWRGLLNSAHIDAFGQQLALADPTELSWEKESGQFRVQPHCWQQKSASLCLTEELLAAAEGSAGIVLSGYQLAWLEKLLPEHLIVAGAVSADSRIQWAPEQAPTLALDAQVSDGTVGIQEAESGELVRFHYQQLALSAAASAEKVTARLSLTSGEIGDAVIDLSLAPDEEGRPISGRATLDGLNIAFLRSFLPQIQTLTGAVSAQGRLSGTLSQPAYIGELGVHGLAIASPDLPIDVRDGQITADIDGSKGTLQGTWKSGGGPVRLNGQADWTTPQWSTDIQLEGRELEVLYKPLVQARISPVITIRLQPRLIDVNGRVEIPYGRITLKELPENVTAISRDVVIISDEPLEEKAESDWTIKTNLRLLPGNDVRLSGMGLRAELHGDLRLKQTPHGPLESFGEIVVANGIYKAYGQNLKVKNGRLRFVGPIDTTSLDIDAVRQVGSVTAGLHLRGTFAEPEITLFSNPPLPEEEALAYIILGRPIGAKGSGDGNVLAGAALALGIKGGGGLANDIATQFGITDFEIEAEDSGVVMSGRLSPDLMVRYGVGVFTPEDTLSLRYNLTEQLYVETIQGIESALDIFYSFDF